MTKHTLGPWKAGCRDNSGVESVYADNGDGIRICSTNPGCGCCEREVTDTDRANARLIAAAPELLEALKAMLVAYAPFWYDQKFHKLHLAVQKAVFVQKKVEGGDRDQ